jgi:hypothetical protein
MDKTKPATARNLLDAAAAAAGVLGVALQYMHPTPRKGPAALRVAHGGQEAQYTVEVRHALQIATLGAAQQQLERRTPPALLVTDYVAPALADELKARHIQFLDAAGNAYLEQGPLLVWVKGQARGKTGDSNRWPGIPTHRLASPVHLAV